MGARTCLGPGPAPGSASPFLPHLRQDGRTLPGCEDQTRWRAQAEQDLLSKVIYVIPGFVFSFRARSNNVRCLSQRPSGGSVQESCIPQPGPAVWGFTGRFHNHSKPLCSPQGSSPPSRRPSPQPFTPTPTFIKSLGGFPENGLISMWGLTAVSLKHKSPCDASGPRCQVWAPHL